jgi:transposase
MFGQLAYRDSLRDVIACLDTHQEKLYHLGFRSLPQLSACARANEKRDWRIFRDLCNILIGEARSLYAGEPAIASDIDSACFAIDSTSIELCLALFPSLPFVSTKGAVKLHLGLDLRGSIPAFFDMTSGKHADSSFLDRCIYESGSFYILDRGYLDYVRLHRIHTSGAFFVTRAKVNTKFTRRYSQSTSDTITCDQVGMLDNKKYPDTIRRIKYTDETGHTYVFLTNNMTVSATSIALLYKNRWKVELFFKWIKQHLKIKRFWGHSENAVKLQICVALCTYLIVAIMKKKLHLPQNLYEILQILSVSLFDKSGLVELFSKKSKGVKVCTPENTLQLFDF